MSYISEFRSDLVDLIDSIEDSPIEKIYDFMPAEMKDANAVVFGDIVDRSHDTRQGITQLLYIRQVIIYCLVKIKDYKRAEAEAQADEISEFVLEELEDSTYSYNVQVRKSVGYGIGQYQYQGIELTLEFYQED